MLELTNTEQTIMQCIWDLDKDVTVADLLKCLKERYEKEYARTTISVFMSYLRDKGYVTYEKKSHAFIYRPLVSEEEYQKDLMSRYIERNFNGSLTAFVEVVLKNEKPSKETCKALRQMIDIYDNQHNHR